MSTRVRLFVLICCACVCACASSPSGISRTEDRESRDPKRSQALTLAALDVIESDAARAEELMHQAVQADLYYGPVHNNLGVLYLRQSKLFEAANEFELARKLMPGNAEPRLNLGLTLEKAGRYELAFEAYSAALEVSPAHIRSIQAIARLTLRTRAREDGLVAMLADIALRGETEAWRSWAVEQMSRLRELASPQAGTKPEAQ